MNICFVSICQFNEYTGGIDRVSCILAREFLNIEHKVFSCFSRMGTRKQEIGISECQLPFEEVPSEGNVSYLHNFIEKHKIDIIKNKV